MESWLQLQLSCFPCRPRPQTSIKSATSDPPVSIRPRPPPSEQSNFVMFGTRHRRLVLQITISGHASNYESKGPSFLLSLRGSKSSSLVVEERGENGAASQQQQDKGRRRHCTDTTTMHMHRRRATTEVTWHSSMGMRPQALARPWLAQILSSILPSSSAPYSTCEGRVTCRCRLIAS